MEHPTVMIENGTTTSGLAGKFEQKIETDNYPITIAQITNALTRDHATSQIIDYTGGKRPNTVSYLQNVLKVQVSQPQTPVKNPPADIVVILGADYAATTTSSTGTTTGSKSSTLR